MKMNFSGILKFFLVTIINIFIIFVVQFYFNMCGNFDKYGSDLKISLFVSKNSSEEKENIISKLKDYNKFDVVEYIDADSFDKFSESNPEFSEIVPKENFVMPAFVIINNIKANNLNELKNLRKELINIDFIDDAVYDEKAYSVYFKYKNLFENYRDVFTVFFLVLTAVFVLKILLFVLKGFTKNIFVESALGILSAFFAYALMCVMLIIDTGNSIFILDWHVLYIVVPLSLMIAIITKESNV